MRKLLLILAAVWTLAGSAAAEIVQIGDFFYNVDMADGVTTPASIVANPDGTLYSGNVTIPDSVLLPDGTMRMVNKSVSLYNSEIEELTVDMVPLQGNKYMTIYMRNKNNLTRVQFNHLINRGREDFRPQQCLNLGETHGCVHCFLREEENENLIVVDKFNVYGPDGKKLKVALMEEDGDYNLIYPDDNNVFHLDKNWRHDNRYCMVLPVSLYTVIVLVGIDENGDVIFVRTESAPTHTGLYAYDGAFTYEVSSQGAYLIGATEGADVPADVVIPESVEYDGKAVTVNRTAVNAFQGLDMKTVTLPATVDSINNYCFYDCPELESVDLSATKVKAPMNLFYRCPKLTEVSLPETLVKMQSTFTNCELLEHVDIPESCKQFSGTFTNCPSIKEIVLPTGSNYNNLSSNSGLIEANWQWINDGTLQMAITNMGIKFSDGTVPEYYPYTLFNFGYYETEDYSSYVYGYFFHNGINAGADNVYTFNLSAFYAPDFAPAYLKDKFQNKVNIGTHEEYDKDNNKNPKQFVLGSLDAPEPGTTGIEAPVIVSPDAHVELFNLQGMRVYSNSPAPGIYIRRQGNKTEKILIK